MGLNDKREIWEKVNKYRGWEALNNLPSKFQSLELVQEKAIDEVMGSSAPVVVLDAPPGSGKTVIGESVRLLSNCRGVYICHSKGLQDQFLGEFNYAAVLKGRSNYPTLPHYPGITAADCDKNPGDDESCSWCSSVSGCPYESAKKVGIRSDVLIVNSSYWVVESNYGGGSVNRGRGLVIFDEADTIERVLEGFVEVRISERMVKRYGLGRPGKVTKEESWKEWVEEALVILDNVPIPLLKDLHSIRESKRLSELGDKLRRLRTGLDIGDWTFDGKDNHILFRSVGVGNVGQELLWDHLEGKKVLLMSATFIDPATTLRNLGYNGDWDLVRVPSTYPVENRRVYVGAGVKVGRDDDSRTKVASSVSKVLNRHDHDRVLIHTVSYSLARTIAEVVGSTQQDGTPGREVFLYLSAADRERVVAEWQNSPGGICIAPSLDRGLDLPGECCRVVIVAKVPYPNLGDKVVSKRLYGTREGQLWYDMETIRSLVQMTGRGVRSKEDWCRIYVLDQEFLKLWRRRRELFPKWWGEAVIVR